MPSTLERPGTNHDLAAFITDSANNGKSLEILGKASRRGFGRPTEISHQLDMSRFDGIIDYEPEELILTVKPGTRLFDLEQTLASQGQHLAFEPPDFGPLWGVAPHQGTIGGAIATGLAGPRRLKVGAPRDHLLGFTAVAGTGTVFKAGGKVVKNVTGYDLPKLMCGSFGTLAVLTELTLKVLPRPETERSLVVLGLDPVKAGALMTYGLSGPWEITGAAYLPEQISRASGIEAIGNSHRSVTVLRMEGVGASLPAHSQKMALQLTKSGPNFILDQEPSRLLWQEIRNAAYFIADGTALWRLSVPPAQGCQLLSSLNPNTMRYFMDWAGGLIWVSVPAVDEAAAGLLRGAAQRFGGTATLLRAPSGIRRNILPFPPLAAPLAALSRRVKAAFDPQGILNPGRLIPSESEA